MVIMQPFLDGIKGEFEMDMQKLIIAISFVIMISCILLMIFIEIRFRLKTKDFRRENKENMIYLEKLFGSKKTRKR